MRIDEVQKASALPRAETEILLSALLEKERTWILAHPGESLSEPQLLQWHAWEERRGKNEPIPYITGHAAFYGRVFLSRPGALVPRPATEGIVSAAVEWLKEPSSRTVPVDAGIVALIRTLRNIGEPRLVADVGTGSGCIAITLALERPDLRIIATDVSDEALALARENAIEHQVSNRISFRHGPLLDPVADLREPFLLVSNPPYVPEGRLLSRDITDFEPRGAVFAGPKGLDVLLPLVAQAKNHPFCAGFVLECEESQIPPIDTLL